PDRIEQRLALLQARRFGLELHRIGAQPRGSRRKADARARGRLEKGHRHRLAAQGGQLLQRVTLDFLERLGLVEKKSDVLSGERFDAEQVTQAVWHSGPRSGLFFRPRS